MKKLIVITIIGLFLGVAVAPSINAEVDNSNKGVNYHIIFSGVDKKYNVHLTEKQANEIDELLKNIDSHLSNVETIEEAKKIYEQAVFKLNDYGLLGGLNVELAQKIITGEYIRANPNYQFLQNPSNKIENQQFNTTLSRSANVFCLMKATVIREYPPWGIILPITPGLIIGATFGILIYLLTRSESLLNLIMEKIVLPGLIRPVRFISSYLLSGFYIKLETFGLKGKVDTSLQSGGAIIGFSGLFIQKDNADLFEFLGFALFVG